MDSKVFWSLLHHGDNIRTAELLHVVAAKVTDSLKIGDSGQTETFETCERGQIFFILFRLPNYLLFKDLEQRNIYSYF